MRGGIVSLLIALVVLSSGCVESTWRLAADSPPSRLWGADPRTRGWTRIDVWYWLYRPNPCTPDASATCGDAVAHLSSPERGTGFKANGTWFVPQNGREITFQFDGKQERYELITGGWLRVLPSD